jgi:hypothetical protein
MHSKSDPLPAFYFAECYIEMGATPATQCHNADGVRGKDHTLEIFSLLGGSCSSANTNEPHKSCLKKGVREGVGDNVLSKHNRCQQPWVDIFITNFFPLYELLGFVSKL